MSSSAAPAFQEDKAPPASESPPNAEGVVAEDDAAAHSRAEVVESENGQDEAVISPGAGKKVALESPTAMSDMEKKQKRAERFGVGLNFSEDEKRKLRASRFNSSKGVAKATGIAINAEAEKKAARAARFGTGNNTSANEDAKKKARAERFSGIDSNAEAEKRKARAARFGTGNEDSLKAKKIKTDTAVAAVAQS